MVTLVVSQLNKLCSIILLIALEALNVYLGLHRQHEVQWKLSVSRDCNGADVDLCVLRAINSQRSPDCVSHHLKLGIVFTQDGCAVAVQGKIPGRAALVIGGPNAQLNVV